SASPGPEMSGGGSSRLRDRNATVILCACQPRDARHCPAGQCATTSSCYAKLHPTAGSSELGCFSNRTEGHHELDRMQCRSKARRLQAGEGAQNVFCCGNADFCNRNLTSGLDIGEIGQAGRTARLPSAASTRQASGRSASAASPGAAAFLTPEHAALLAVVAAMAVALAVSLALLFLLFLRRRQRRKGGGGGGRGNVNIGILGGQADCGGALVVSPSSSYQQQSYGPPIAVAAAADPRLPASLSSQCVTDTALTSSALTASFDLSSGSGRGVPFLFDRSVAQQVKLIRQVGQGRYGSVWAGQYMGGRLAVKIFCSRDEASFRRECQMYTSFPLGHESILTFRASDITSREGCTQFWLISEYHPLGSLHDFLQREPPLPARLGLQLALGALSGLCYLHTEVRGLHGKPAIAHRDVKSRNILVKENLTCCIADLGLAVVAREKAPPEMPPKSARVGTKRYMPPELLADSFNWHEFEAYKSADVYSMGLVLWEIGIRMVTEAGSARPYGLPYHEFVGIDPSFDEMKEIVCQRQLRPGLPDSWADSATMQAYQALLAELWHELPAARLPALRAVMDLTRLAERLPPNSAELLQKQQMLMDTEPLLAARNGV
ncbi:hypothetical protein BOX15_Mlig032325g2, partial [Macrostomum lignano]